MKKDYESRERKTGKFKLKMTFAILVLAALSIVELYLMMNFQTEYLYLGIVGLGILCFVYWTVDISFKMQQENDTVGGWEYENLYKAEKVSYISMKQSFSDIEKMLQDIVDLPADDVIQSQKAIGKVMIQRNKESTQTIMDSQKELAERIDAVEAKMSELKDMLDTVSTQSGAEASNVQQEILEILQRLERSVAQGIQISQETVMQDNLNIEEATENVSTMEGEGEVEIEEAAIEETATPEEPVIEEEPTVSEETTMGEESTVSEEPVIEEEPTASDEPGVEEESPIKEEPIAPEESIDESSVMEEPIAPEISTLEEEPAVQEETAAEEAPAVPEEKPDMPNLSDPNHVMTPEEIAALLANM